MSRQEDEPPKRETRGKSVLAEVSPFHAELGVLGEAER